VAEHFQVLPFLPALQSEQKHFFIVALSQQHVRLLRCTDHSSEEVPLRPGTPTSVEQWLNTRTPTESPDHGTVRQSEAGPGGNFNGSTDMDNLDRHIRNFFLRVNESVFDALRGETAPLVIAAVEYEASLWRSINTYPHLAEGHVQGSPDGLRGGELHARALDVAKAAFEQPMLKALQTYEKLGGSERVSTKPAEIVKASHEARVAHLFLAEGASHPGRWDRETMQVTSEGAGEDFLNIAALQTIANGGEVWVTTPAKIPGGGPAAALLRF
jgi:Bacterial archaeo-eukaryotic release factor family 3